MAADVSAIVQRLAKLLMLRANSEVRVTDNSEGQARTPAPGDIVRAAVARSVLGGVGSGGSVACEISVGDGIFLHVTGAMQLPTPDSDLLDIAAVHDVRITSRGQMLELRFPAVDPRATPDAPA